MIVLIEIVWVCLVLFYKKVKYMLLDMELKGVVFVFGSFFFGWVCCIFCGGFVRGFEVLFWKVYRWECVR